VLSEAASALRGRPEVVAERVADLQNQLRDAKKGASSAQQVDPASLVADAVEVDGVRVLSAASPVAEPKGMMELVDKLKGKLGESVVVLGSGADGRVHLVVGATAGAIERGVKAGAIVKIAAQVVGGGGGGRDTMAQAGGKHPEKLPDALAAARAEVEKILTG
jgi:alanyl-tRNA synthetase